MILKVLLMVLVLCLSPTIDSNADIVVDVTIATCKADQYPQFPISRIEGSIRLYAGYSDASQPWFSYWPSTALQSASFSLLPAQKFTVAFTFPQNPDPLGITTISISGSGNTYFAAWPQDAYASDGWLLMPYLSGLPYSSTPAATLSNSVPLLVTSSFCILGDTGYNANLIPGSPGMVATWSLSVSEVPEPSAIFLFILGIVSLIGYKSRNQ